MTKMVPVVDLFSGPGGLAEGFAALDDDSGDPRFQIALSIEKDPSAHRTLRLRAFLRKFNREFPDEYYDFLNGVTAEEPDWATLFPEEWQDACDETLRLTLGAEDLPEDVGERVRAIRKDSGTRTVLLGGPPCQSYSVAGRARNAGIEAYNADEDERQSLYQQYADVLGKLQPAVAVMENVKGMLSAKHEGRLIFPDVMESLRNAGGERKYVLYGLCSSDRTKSWGNELEPKDFLVRAEAHGVPQARHRVFVVCVRADVARGLPEDVLPKLQPNEDLVSVHDVIGDMPTLRSRLSRDDSGSTWKEVVRNGCNLIETFRTKMEKKKETRFLKALGEAREASRETIPPFGNAIGDVKIGGDCSTDLSDWIVDENITRLPNNETRGHMQEDLWRYLFAAAFARAFGRSARASDFPSILAPNHANWDSGKFADRFRVQLQDRPATTITSHISKDGHYFIHPDPAQCRSLTVREAARLQTFPDNYFFHGGRSQQYVQVGNAVPPYLAWQIAKVVWDVLDHHDRARSSGAELGLVAAEGEPPADQSSCVL